MNKERAIITATQFFRFWKYEWSNLSNDQKIVKNYVPNSDDISREYDYLEEDAVNQALKSNKKEGFSECGRLKVGCTIMDGRTFFDYYINAS
jgi:hypothetical protein